jgi:small conductance mechanosensitive channel
MDTRFDLIKQVKETFEARGLNFPYPHQVAIERAPQRAQGFRRQA